MICDIFRAGTWKQKRVMRARFLIYSDMSILSLGGLVWDSIKNWFISIEFCYVFIKMIACLYKYSILYTAWIVVFDVGMDSVVQPLSSCIMVVCMRACVHVHVCVHVCMRVRERVCVCACACVWGVPWSHAQAWLWIVQGFIFKILTCTTNILYARIWHHHWCDFVCSINLLQVILAN